MSEHRIIKNKNDISDIKDELNDQWLRRIGAEKDESGAIVLQSATLTDVEVEIPGNGGFIVPGCEEITSRDFTRNVSSYLKRVREGEKFSITVHGKHMAYLVSEI